MPARMHLQELMLHGPQRQPRYASVYWDGLCHLGKQAVAGEAFHAQRFHQLDMQGRQLLVTVAEGPCSTQAMPGAAVWLSNELQHQQLVTAAPCMSLPGSSSYAGHRKLGVTTLDQEFMSS